MRIGCPLWGHFSPHAAPASFHVTGGAAHVDRFTSTDCLLFLYKRLCFFFKTPLPLAFVYI